METIDGFQRYKIAYTNTFSKPPWFESVSEEYAACRERVGLSDYSSFTKIDLWVMYITTDSTDIVKISLCFFNILNFLVEWFGSGRSITIFVLK